MLAQLPETPPVTAHPNNISSKRSDDEFKEPPPPPEEPTKGVVASGGGGGGGAKKRLSPQFEDETPNKVSRLASDDSQQQQLQQRLPTVKSPRKSVQDLSYEEQIELALKESLQQVEGTPPRQHRSEEEELQEALMASMIEEVSLIWRDFLTWRR